MATEKIVSYSAEQTAELVARYQAGESVESLGAAMGKSVRSVIAKLSREKVYASKEKAAVAGRVTKAAMVAAIAAKAGVADSVVESLEKATGEALAAVLKALEA